MMQRDLSRLGAPELGLGFTQFQGIEPGVLHLPRRGQLNPVSRSLLSNRISIELRLPRSQACSPIGTLHLPVVLLPKNSAQADNA